MNVDMHLPHSSSFLAKGAVYFMLGNLDPALRSRLEAINLVALFKSNLLKRYSLDTVIKPFIDDLRKLQFVRAFYCNTNHC